MSSTTNGMCGIEGSQPAERTDIQPFQGSGVGMTPTQGCTLGTEAAVSPALKGLYKRTRDGSILC